MIHRHHRKMRSQGGTDDPSNIMFVSPELHRFIHDNPGLSYARGWLVKSWQEPSEVPISPHPELRFACSGVCECGGICADCAGEAA
jgi:hypothetical protein